MFEFVCILVVVYLTYKVVSILFNAVMQVVYGILLAVICTAVIVYRAVKAFAKLYRKALSWNPIITIGSTGGVLLLVTH